MQERAPEAKVAPQSALPPTSAPYAQRASRWRRPLLLLGPLLVAILALYGYATGGRYVSTDNAYLKADKVTLSAQIAGPIVEVLVKENEGVAKGAFLFRIDRTPYAEALARAEAQVAIVKARIAGLKATYQQKMHELAVAEANATHADRDHARQTALRQSNIVSEAKYDQVRHEMQQALRRIEMARSDALTVLAQLAGNPDIADDSHPLTLEAAAARNTAAIELGRTDIPAPFDGVVSKLPQLGQHVTPGSAVSSLAAMTGLWIEANFKETDLTHVKAGQTVEISIDAYPDIRWRGAVDSLAPATGAEFSVLPPQNATGNWVKIVQRIPVRVRLETSPDLPQLRVGMSSHVNIDTGAREGWLSRLGLGLQRARVRTQAGDR